MPRAFERRPLLRASLAAVQCSAVRRRLIFPDEVLVMKPGATNSTRPWASPAASRMAATACLVPVPGPVSFVLDQADRLVGAELLVGHRHRRDPAGASRNQPSDFVVHVAEDDLAARLIITSRVRPRM